MLTKAEYIKQALKTAGITSSEGQIFVKVLTSNDDSGRHGVLVPTEAYDFFPYFHIEDPSLNATTEFESYDIPRRNKFLLGYKYYKRYPERRITRLSAQLNDRGRGLRLFVAVKATNADGSSSYVVDATDEGDGSRFAELWSAVAGPLLAPYCGAFVVAPFDYSSVRIDQPLSELLKKFDSVAGVWHPTTRPGDTGVGHTFETLLGIEENNSKQADFKGIEIKCKRAKGDANGRSGKINLFQQAPSWAVPMRVVDRLNMLAGLGNDCYSQVNMLPNNLQLYLQLDPCDEVVRIRKDSLEVGHWRNSTLEKRLQEKHRRAVFIKAHTRRLRGAEQFLYEELIYCESPQISMFLELLRENRIVFEFLMSRRGSSVRNHGYPWRLVSDKSLERLFGFRVRLR